MGKEKETWYERINAPYETVDETRRELFETLDWQKAVAKTFAIFSSLRKENNKVINVSVNWELEHVLPIFSRALTANLEEEYQKFSSDEILKKINYFRAEFSNRHIEKIDLSTLEGFSQLLDAFTTISQQWLMRAKLHARLMMWMSDEEIDELEKEPMLLEWFLEKEKSNKEVSEAYAHELYDIFTNTWGVKFWIEKSKEALITLGIEEPTEQDIMELAEMAFNGYLKDIFWIELPPLHFVAINQDEQEELIKAEFWFTKLYSYILKNQLPS